MGERTSADWAKVFSAEFATDASAVQSRVWADVFGREYPAELAPYSYTSWTELSRMAEDVAVGTGDLLVDVGAGRGGPGLWIAARTQGEYLAVDIARSGLDQVEALAGRVGLGDRVAVAEGSFEHLPLADAQAAAVMSIDALLFTSDKQAAIGELARVIRPSGKLVFTTWDYHSQPAGRPPQIADHRPFLTAAGFDVLAYDETPDWERRQRETGRLLMDAVAELAAESGQPVSDVRAALAEMNATTDTMIRRVYVVAERTTLRPPGSADLGT